MFSWCIHYLEKKQCAKVVHTHVYIHINESEKRAAITFMFSFLFPEAKCKHCMNTGPISILT